MSKAGRWYKVIGAVLWVLVYGFAIIGAGATVGLLTGVIRFGDESEPAPVSVLVVVTATPVDTPVPMFTPTPSVVPSLTPVIVVVATNTLTPTLTPSPIATLRPTYTSVPTMTPTFLLFRGQSCRKPKIHSTKHRELSKRILR